MKFNLICPHFLVKGLHRSRIEALVVLLSLFTLPASAQNYPVNPNYNPVTPDYIEQEFCEITNNAFANEFTTGCIEIIEFPAPGNMKVIQGYADSSLTWYSIDVYGFELTEETEMRIRMTQSHLIGFGMMIVGSHPDYYNCVPGASYVNPSHTGQLGIPGVTGENIDVTHTFPPGLYKMAVFHNDDTIEEGYNFPCGSVEYQVELTNVIDYYMPGDVCHMAIEVDPEDTFNESRVMDDMADAFSFGNFSCASDIGQVERWYKFTAEKTTSFISARREGTGNFNPVIEVYNSCGGSPILCQDNDLGAQELIIFPTVPGQEYRFRVYHKGPQALNNTAMSAAVAHVPSTQLRSLDCNRMNLQYTDIIRSDWPSNSFLLANWEFKFESMDNPNDVYEILSPNGSNPQFRMSWFPQAQPGTTYRVSTRPRMYQGPTWGDYAGTCFIGTAHDFAAFTAPDMPEVDFGHATAFGSHELKVWPNPAQNEVTISFNAGREDLSAEVSIFDASGKRVDSFQKGVAGASVQNAVYQTSALPGGVYLVRVQTETGVSTSKLVVSR